MNSKAVTQKMIREWAFPYRTSEATTGCIGWFMRNVVNPKLMELREIKKLDDMCVRVRYGGMNGTREVILVPYDTITGAHNSISLILFSEYHVPLIRTAR